MPTKSDRVSAEFAIANIMRFMEHYYNNDTVTVILR
jgi:Tfp pilus assembly protein PilE